MPRIIEAENRRKLEVKEEKLEVISLYPNPNGIGKLWLTGFENDEEITMSIYNIQGIIISHGVISEEQIDISELKSGTYFIEIYGRGKTMHRDKLIIQ